MGIKLTDIRTDKDKCGRDSRLRGNDRAYGNDVARDVALLGVLLACALVLSYVESLVPIPLPVPGIKIGLANAVSLFALYRMGWKSALIINILRVVLSGLMFTGFSAMLYGLVGGILSVLVMIIVKKTGVFSIIGVSAAGASVHVSAQIVVAYFIIENASIFMYLPVILISAVISGIIIGFITYLVLVRAYLW
jgi:heptaprenyl diphosphate synthase